MGLTKSVFYLSQGPFQMFFLEDNDYKKISELKLKVFLKLWENHPAVVETAFYISRKMMWGKHIFEKTWGFYWKLSFEQKRIGRLVKTAFQGCGEILYELCVLQTIFPRNFFADFLPQFFVNVFKTAFNVSPKSLRAMNFLR